MNTDRKIITSDEDLLRKCLEGEESAWEQFYKRFSSIVLCAVSAAARKFLNKIPPDDLKDCEQYLWAEIMGNNYATLRKWKRRCSLSTWLRVCCCNAAINYFKSSERYASRNISYESDILMNREEIKYSPTEIVDKIKKKKHLERIKDIIQKRLTNRERFFATLFWFDGYSIKDIAKIMDIPSDESNSLYVLKYKIEKKIKEIIEDSP